MANELPRFSLPLRVELTGKRRSGRPIWKVLEEFRLQCRVGEAEYDIAAPVGFETDFASVPRFFWRFAPPGGPYAGAAVIHDYLYANRIGEREVADRIFLEGMIAANVEAWRRTIIFRTVRTFGGRGWGN
ncbi:DUF1353 domain-containing protein [Euryhalocaulis caribicus]|uniref:DUF1353 domain-containing protein n=1 Tax=Euryhalocaulis caribicus TaxID=1161401 RepID=UPI00039A278B|nr:DUF1353 domain-containing protein [Euryhalocaulis caribicus]